jgi:hypothetical protein
MATCWPGSTRRSRRLIFPSGRFVVCGGAIEWLLVELVVHF